MRALLFALIVLCVATVPAQATCNGAVEKNIVFSDPEKPDTFDIEAWGDTCQTAHILIYVRNGAGWHPLVVGDLADFLSQETTQATLSRELKLIAERIEGPQKSRLESWAEIQSASTQPKGEPWRGTPLVQAEYERLYKAKSRYVFIPIGTPRAKMVVWDEHGKHPVDFVYYGD
jgi:hypothetical protein